MLLQKIFLKEIRQQSFLLKTGYPTNVMQQIAMENNLSETAFFVPIENGFHIRWFTPLAEVNLCGHATLASAHVLFQHLKLF